MVVIRDDGQINQENERVPLLGDNREEEVLGQGLFYQKSKHFLKR